MKRIVILVGAFMLSSSAFIGVANAAVRIPSNTLVYIATDKEIIGKKKFVREGDLIPVHVWRDVKVDGVVVIKAGAPAVAKIDSLKTAKVAGIKGKMAIGVLETTASDGTTVPLSGGYNKAGKGRIGLSAALGGIIFLPLIFIPGGAAKLPAGTVIDAYTQGEVTVDLVGRGTYPTINLAGFTQSAMTVEVLYDQLEGNDNPKWFDLLIRTPLDAPAEFVIDTINGNSVRPIDLQILTTTKTDDGKAIRALAEIKPLAKQFRKGINTFEVAYGSGTARVSAEVVLNIQF